MNKPMSEPTTILEILHLIEHHAPLRREEIDTLRAAIEEGRPRVSREFVERWANHPDFYYGYVALEPDRPAKVIIAMLRELGHEVEEVPEDGKVRVVEEKRRGK